MSAKVEEDTAETAEMITFEDNVEFWFCASLVSVWLHVFSALYKQAHPYRGVARNFMKVKPASRISEISAEA